MVCLLFLNTLFWTGVLPFPFHGLAKETSSQQLIPCPPKNMQEKKLAEITAKVFNAGSESGLASEVAEALQDQDVQVAEIGNWEGPAVTAPVLLIATKKNLAAAYTLRAFFPNATIQLSDEKKLDSVNIVIGNNWDSMHKNPQEKDFQKAAEPLTGCVEP